MPFYLTNTFDVTSAPVVRTCCLLLCIHNVINLVPPMHWRRKLGGQLKILLTKLKGDFIRISSPNVLGLRQRSLEQLSLKIALTPNRHNWATANRDMVAVSMDTGATSTGSMSSRVSKLTALLLAHEFPKLCLKE